MSLLVVGPDQLLISYNRERFELSISGSEFQVTSVANYTMNKCLFNLRLRPLKRQYYRMNDCLFNLQLGPLKHVLMSFVVTLFLFDNIKVIDSDNWNGEDNLLTILVL